MGRPVDGGRGQEHLGNGSGRDRDAERRRGRRRVAWRAAGRGARDDVHGLAGPAADDSQHVQDRRRTDLGGHPRCGAHARHARAVDFRRPQRRDGGPADRVRAARRQFRSGSARLRADRAGRDAGGARAVPAFLRRVPHLARGQPDRRAEQRRPARADRRRAGAAASRARDVAGPSDPARDGAESRRVFPGARDDQPLLPGLSDHRAGRDGPLRAADRAPLSPVRLLRRAGRRTRRGPDGLGRGRRGRDGRGPAGARRKGRPAQGPAVPAVCDRELPCGAAQHRQVDRRARPHQGAGRDRRAALPRRSVGLCRAHLQRGGNHHAADHRRALRPVVEGIHAGDGQGGVRRTQDAGAEEPLHGRHRRRRFAHEPRLRPGILDRGSAHGAGAVLRARLGRHGRREQELDQDHRQGDGQLRPGLFRLRLQEGGIGHGLAFALRAEPDPLDLPDHQGEFRRLPPVPVPQPDRHAGGGRGGRHLPAQRSARPQRSVGPSAARGAGRNHPQEAEGLRDRRLCRRARGRHGQPHQHDHADLLLRHQRRASARGGDQADQEGDRGHLRQARRSGGAEELRRGRHHARPPARGEGARPRDQRLRDAAAGAGARAGLRARRARRHDRRQGRHPAGQRAADRRHLPDRHRAMGEAQHRPANPGLGREAVHPVRQVRARVPARGHPRQGL